MTDDPYSSFGFQVLRAGWEGDEDRPEDDWRVCLPHQCDNWDITDNTGWGSGVPHAEAVAELERFITEANLALTHLRERRELGGWPDKNSS